VELREVVAIRIWRHFYILSVESSYECYFGFCVENLDVSALKTVAVFF